MVFGTRDDGRRVPASEQPAAGFPWLTALSRQWLCDRMVGGDCNRLGARSHENLRNSHELFSCQKGGENSHPSSRRADGEDPETGKTQGNQAVARLRGAGEKLKGIAQRLMASPTESGRIGPNNREPLPDNVRPVDVPGPEFSSVRFIGSVQCPLPTAC